MPIVNREKIRPDVLKLFDNIEKVQMKGVYEFLSREENRGVDFQALYSRVMEGNELFFKKEKGVEELYQLFSKDEILFLTSLMRYSFEYISNAALEQYPIPKEVEVESIDVHGIPAEWQTVPGALKSKILLYFHGGGWIMGSPNTHRSLTIELGKVTKMRVLSIDYRLAPEHPYPAALEDCVTIYDWLLSSGIKPENVIIGGDSAGGNLTLSVLLKLKNDGYNLPAGAICLSPATDLTLNDDSYFKNAETDPELADLGIYWWMSAYLGEADPSDPFISPLLGDLKGLPPLLFQASTSEMLYGNSVRFVDKAKAAGVNATLQAWDDMPHVFQGFSLNDLPEAREAITKIGKFIQKVII